MLTITCSRSAIRTLKRGNKPELRERTVYVLVAEKPFKYPKGWSRILYIGSTKKRQGGPTVSALERANAAMTEWPRLREVSVHVVACEGRKGMKTWEHLENSLLSKFLGCYGRLPKLNKTYNKRRSSGRQPENVLLFKQDELEKILLRFAL